MARPEAPQGAFVVSKPICECHGEPMIWHPDKRKTLNGYWTCGPRKRERNRLDYYRHHEKRQAKTAEYKRNHRQEYLDYWRERHRTQKGWYDEGGMATKPTQFKELTNE